MSSARSHSHLGRHATLSVVLTWLALGWRDLWVHPHISLIYGLLVSVVAIAAMLTLVVLGLNNALFPALTGFMVIGPFLAVGLYEKSRRIAAGEPVRLSDIFLVRPAAGGDVLFAGFVLYVLALLWMRAAVLIYMMFFDAVTSPSLDHILTEVLTTPAGWRMMMVGTVVGGLFAAFAFAISVFSIPMMLTKPIDALSAMSVSAAYVCTNRRVMIAWGAMVCALTALSLATGFIALIIIFPWLGHSAWHAYRHVVGGDLDAGAR